MPYILQVERDRLDPIIRPNSPGELNYVITQNIRLYVGPEPSYTALNAAIGALECAKLELYRRLAAPYEDGKIQQNGDVYI